MKKLLFLLACASVFCGCGEKQVVLEAPLGEAVYTHNFISSFVKADNLEIAQDANDPLVFYIRDVDMSYVSSVIRDALYKKYSDTTYDRYVAQDPSRSMCYVNEFNSIDITSSADFGAIKAGESLASIVIFRGASAKPYIDYEYKVCGEWTNEIKAEIGEYGMNLLRNNLEYHPIVKRVADLTPNNLILLTPKFVSLRFMETPDIKKHTLYVSIKDDENVYRVEVNAVFP